jgi:hypothetical protein
MMLIRNSLPTLLLLVSCHEGAVVPDAASPDAVVVGCHFTDGTRCGGAGSANRGCAIDSCNWCDCGPNWGDTNVAGCTLVGGCFSPPDAGAGWDRCRSQADCPSGLACIFMVGCDQQLGYCNDQTFYCPHDPTTFTLCGCDGRTVTITVHSCAPDRQYAHVGSCP